MGTPLGTPLRDDGPPGTPLRDETPFDGTHWAANNTTARRTTRLTPQSNDGRSLSPFPVARTPKAISYYAKPAPRAENGNYDLHSGSSNSGANMYANTNAGSTAEAQGEDGSGVETTGMTLDGFIKQHTSEDNEHFKEQQAVSLAAHKKKYWWVYDDDPNHHLRLLSDGQRMSVRKDKKNLHRLLQTTVRRFEVLVT